MSIVISDEVLQMLKISETELLTEIAVMFFQQERFTLAASTTS
jgi:predicted HTH domain antitoxin